MNDQNRARAKEWLNTLERNGVRAQLIPVERLDDLKSRFKDSLLSFGTDPGLYDRYLKGFRFRCSSSSYSLVKSILLTASAQPMMRADFTVDGRTVAVLIPPDLLLRYRCQDHPVMQAELRAAWFPVV